MFMYVYISDLKLSRKFKVVTLVLSSMLLSTLYNVMRLDGVVVGVVLVVR